MKEVALTAEAFSEEPGARKVRKPKALRNLSIYQSSGPVVVFYKLMHFSMQLNTLHPLPDTSPAKCWQRGAVPLRGKDQLLTGSFFIPCPWGLEGQPCNKKHNLHNHIIILCKCLPTVISFSWKLTQLCNPTAIYLESCRYFKGFRKLPHMWPAVYSRVLMPKEFAIPLTYRDRPSNGSI